MTGINAIVSELQEDLEQLESTCSSPERRSESSQTADKSPAQDDNQSKLKVNSTEICKFVIAVKI
jgi:hypothetical protein